MASKIQVLGDTIKIDKAFVSGKDRVSVNDEVVFEGKIGGGAPQNFSAGNREYAIESRTVSKMTGATAIHLRVYEKGELIHSGVYDQAGNPVQNERQARATGAIHVCTIVGGVIGFATMMVLNMATGVVPGGAIGGAIGGGGGAAVGYGIGCLVFGGRK